MQRKNLTTKEEYEQSKNKMMAKIATDKEIAKVEEAKLINDVDNQYSLLVQAFIFFIYLVIYILMLLEQLNITVVIIYNMHQIILNYYRPTHQKIECGHF